MKKDRMQILVTILLIALVLCLIFAPLTFNWLNTAVFDINIVNLGVLLLLFRITLFPFTEIILTTHKLE